MQAQTDSKGNTYFDVGNIRITSVEETWSGDSGIRIQAYKSGTSGALHQGAELPIPDKRTAYDFLKAIHHALEQNGL